MGLFNKILNYIKKHRINKDVKIKLHNIYIPYFVQKETFSTLKKIDEHIDPYIEEIYELIKNDKRGKYTKYIKLFEEHLPKVLIHNQKIDIIDKGMVGFDFSSFIKNPSIYSKEDIEKFYSIANKIDDYKFKSNEYIEYSVYVNKIRDYYDLIVKQKSLKEEYEYVFNFDDSYYGKYEKECLISAIKPLKEFIENSKKIYYDFSKIYNINSLIEEHNKKYLENYKNDTIFDNIRGKSLDVEQRLAILKDEKSSLVVAGAGSGKTLTICGKVKFLLENKKVDPNDILLLSYSKNSATDLSSKVKEIDPRLTVGTFHKIGLDILVETQKKKFNVEEQYNAIIETYFRDEMKNRPNILKRILTYFSMYLKLDAFEQKYNNEGEMYEELKKHDYRTLKIMTETSFIDKKETIKKEIVKSFEEMAIANFYFLNGINYIYECPYEKDVSTSEKRQYNPDFYLTDYKVYHEHYGIDKDGNASHFGVEKGQKYLEDMQWKRQIHNVNSTTCIESYSHEFEDGTIFTKLRENLIAKGVKLNPLSQEQIYNTIMSIYQGENFKSFINLVKSFISLYKAKYSDAAQFKEFKSYSFENGYEKKRTMLFLDIVEDVYNYYREYLLKYNKIDFDDMILKSSEMLDLTDNFKFKYIIVDEFQDISYSRMKFLKKLIEKGDSRLFAVGDDWQAIYRFSGCDLNIFLKFDEYFDYSGISFITSTHRNSQELQNIAGPFIKANPEQYDKTIRSTKSLSRPVKIVYYNDKTEALNKVFADIYALNKNANILILGRNNKDIEYYYSNQLYADKYKKGTIKSTLYPTFNINYRTVHASKGLEDDFVIIINADDNKLGFPNKMEDDKLLDLVLENKSSYLYGEDRRLWYVALTRTKTYTYILANQSCPSIFVDEIENKCEILNQEVKQDSDNLFLCPHCKSGRLVIRKRKDLNQEFYGCSNYPYCEYTINPKNLNDKTLNCPACGDFLLRKNSEYGLFYVCHNNRCNYKIKHGWVMNILTK